MTYLRVCLINRKSSMRNHPHQRKLRRSTGSQPVGCLGGPSQTEAGIAVQVTQAQSSRWTFLSSDDGDLANLVAGDHRVPTRALCSGHYLGISSAFRKDVERFASAAPHDHAKHPYPEQPSKRLLRFHRFASSCSRQATSFQLKTASNL